jgi:hypothetical protein
VGAVLPVVALAALHIYDLSLAVLLGMLFPSLVQERTATPFFAMILHLFLLIVPVLQAVVVYTASRAVTESVLVFLLLNATSLVFMIAICEGTVRALWGQLVRALDISPADAAAL